MRQGQQNNKRMRGRSRKGPNTLTRSFESNGGDVKIRGTALHVAEKYGQLARDAQSSGDRVAAENYFQHAEHYYRIVAAAQAQLPQPQPTIRSDGDGDGDGDDDDDRDSHGNGSGGERQPARQGNQPGNQPAFGPSDPQPYVNGGDSDQPGYEGGDAVASTESGGGGRDRGGQGGGFRRRRPYRDRHGGERAEQSGRADAGAEPSQGED